MKAAVSYDAATPGESEELCAGQVMRYYAGMETIGWDEFAKVELRAGTIIAIEDFPEARKPAYKLTIDFGEIGIKHSSAQITKHYRKEDILGKQVIGVINFPPKRIGPFISECLTTGFADENGDVVLALIERRVPNGAKMF